MTRKLIWIYELTELTEKNGKIRIQFMTSKYDFRDFVI